MGIFKKISNMTGILCESEIHKIYVRMERYAKQKEIEVDESANFLLRTVSADEVRMAAQNIPSILSNQYPSGITAKYRMSHVDISKKSIAVPFLHRFSAYSSPILKHVGFPISADMKFSIVFSLFLDGRETRNTKKIFKSFNELIGLCDDGHCLHWSHHSIVGDFSNIPTSIALANLSCQTWNADPLYNRPDCSLGDILPIGTHISYQNGNTGFMQKGIVSGITEKSYSPIERHSGDIFIYYDIVCAKADEDGEGYDDESFIIREVVPKGGKIIPLFRTNSSSIMFGDVDDAYLEWVDANKIDIESNEGVCGDFQNGEAKCGLGYTQTNLFDFL